MNNFNPTGKNQIISCQIFIAKDTRIFGFDEFDQGKLAYALEEVLTQDPNHGIKLQHVGIFAKQFFDFSRRLTELYYIYSKRNEDFEQLSLPVRSTKLYQLLEGLEIELSYNPYMDIYFIRKEQGC